MDAVTFHGLYERHAPDVSRFARFLTGSADEAAEITAETFFRAWVGRSSLRATTAKAYLLAIARNLARDGGRRRRRFPGGAVPEQAVRERSTSGVQLRETMDALRRLPVEYREPLALAASGLGYQEVAEVLGLPLATVKIRIHRARLRLAALLEDGTPGAPQRLPRKDEAR
jgi:RNA polymerase sigma-70 factor (ECF subfamily)